MSAGLESLVSRWLHSLKINVSHSYLRDKLRSHPDYPSMASITGILDDMNIDNAALIVDKEKTEDVPTPFLAHIGVNGGEFVVINDVKKQLQQNSELEKSWNGVALLAEKPQNWQCPENEIYLAKERKLKSLTAWCVAAIFLLAFVTLFKHFHWQLAGLVFSSVAGLAVAVLIKQKELGISNELTNHLCGLGKNTDCEAVMQSSGNKLGKWFSWADAGVIYFSSFFQLLIISPQELGFLTSLSTIAIPFTFFSLYYQWKVVKKWCPLCLVAVTVLWMQFLLLLPSLAKPGLYLADTNEVLGGLLIIIPLTVVWLLIIKPALDRTRDMVERNYSLLRFKNDPEIFNALLRQQRRVDILPFEDDLQLGNAAAPTQIMVACNPYCAPCARAHEILDKIVSKNDIGLTVRFHVKSGNREDKRTQAVGYLLQLLIGKTNLYKREVLHSWYSLMNMEKFKTQYSPDHKKEVEDLLNRHEQWAIQARILFTPTIFINGFEMPKQYGIDDLPALLKAPLTDDAKNKLTDPEIRNDYALT